MYRVLRKEDLTPSAFLLEVEDSRASLVKPGQYALVIWRDGSEPVPLSFLSTTENSYTFLVEVRGRTTLEMRELLEESIAFIEAPCGNPFPVDSYGKVLLISKNWGIAPLLNVGRALKEKGNEVHLIHVGETEEKVYRLKELEELGALFLYTEDGSLGEEGNTEWAVRSYIERYGKPDLVVSAGSNIDSRIVSEVTSEKGIKHIAMVNAYILDANGLCLACRVLVNGEEKLACVDGPWFDGSKVNWDYAIEKEFMYREEEEKTLKEFLRKLERERKKKQRNTK